MKWLLAPIQILVCLILGTLMYVGLRIQYLRERE